MMGTLSHTKAIWLFDSRKEKRRTLREKKNGADNH
jgi:hypothetical protein